MYQLEEISRRPAAISISRCTARSKVSYLATALFNPRIPIDCWQSFNLPDDVFEAGETKPQKKSAKSLANKKRGPTEVIRSHRLFPPRCGMRCLQSDLPKMEREHTDWLTGQHSASEETASFSCSCWLTKHTCCAARFKPPFPFGQIFP